MICERAFRERSRRRSGRDRSRRDHLFALTHAIMRWCIIHFMPPLHSQDFDFWMHDNECWEPGQELEKAIKALAKAWRDMLRRSDAELGIDAEYTRPGIEALLGQLQDHFECCEAAEDFPFNWRA